MSHVDLGFSQECEVWQIESYFFPSKIGGKPAWLNLEALPTPENLQCDNCHQPLTFLCQVYAPFEEDEANFHRTIFVFICRDSKCCFRNSSCNIKAFRCSLPRYNKFYSSEPPEEKNPDFSLSKWVKLCHVCGCLGEKKCGKCKKVNYCSREHQVIDWKQGHKNECEGGKIEERISTTLFSQSELVIEAEEISDKTVDESEELKKYEQLKCEGKIGTMSDVADNEMEKYAILGTDKAFARFKKRIGDNNDQVLRYDRGGHPLWIASNPKLDTIPNCENCGSPRQYEFQIMPQMFAILRENDLDVGIIVIYSCSKSCIGGDSYKREFVVKQDVEISN